MQLESAARLGLMPLEEAHDVRCENPCQGFELVPANEIMHVITDTSEAQARALLKNWDIGKLRPIGMTRGDGGKLILKDGDHRLRVMRQLGYRDIPAIVAEGRGP